MKKLLFSLLLSTATVTVAAHAAGACPRDIADASSYRRGGTHPVVLATDDLNASRNAEAIARLYDRYGFQINGWAFNPTTADSRQREVVLIVGLATLRTEGRVHRDYVADEVTDPAVARGNVKWAIRAIEGLAFVGYAPQRHLAEAWARDPDLADAAREKLQALADDGKLLSSHQYRVLARLHHEAGDHDRAEQARRKADQKVLD